MTSTCRVLQGVAQIIEVLRAASAQDPNLADVWDQDGDDPRLVVHTAAARRLVRKPGAKTTQHAADLLYGLLSPELYLLFVRDRKWSAARWEQWVLQTLEAQLSE